MTIREVLSGPGDAPSFFWIPLSDAHVTELATRFRADYFTGTSSSDWYNVVPNRSPTPLV